MSNRYKGGIISATPPTTTGGQTGVASGAWTLEQQMQAQAAGLWPVAPPDPNLFIENLFSTWLYTGNGSTQTITNGIDLAGKGGMTWIKRRDAVRNHQLFDTVRGATKLIYSDLNNAEYTDAFSLTAFNSNGFSLGLDGGGNANGGTYASWTFREQPKFFDVVTYTGNGSARTIAHNLGSEPGCMIVKCTSATNNWQVYHRSTDAGMGPNKFMVLNSTAGESTGSDRWNNTAPTSTVFSVGNAPETNQNGATYVAYLFAHNAGGFGLSGTDNVISCGSYTGTGSAFDVNLGYEVQWVMIKRATGGTGEWTIFDNMRGMAVGSPDVWLYANTTDADQSGADQVNTTATGFRVTSTGTRLNSPGDNYIYIAIRRGPMATPTTGSSVFALSTWVGSAGNKDLGSQTTNFGTGYFAMLKSRNGAQDWGQFDTIRGFDRFLDSNAVTSEFQDPGGISVVNGRLQLNNNSYFGAGGDGAGQNYIGQFFRRAPGFFDEVCYRGNGGGLGTTTPHNLGVLPEMVVVKCRSADGSWWVAHKDFFNNGRFESTAAWNEFAYNANISPFSSATQLSTAFGGNTNGENFVAYLFASCPGVSRVGSYTGSGSTQTINCGFTAGARFVLIKSTNAVGDWYVWDSTRGIVSANDPYLRLNSNGIEVTNTDWVDTAAVGFEVSNSGGNLVNSNAVTYMFLAIA